MSKDSREFLKAIEDLRREFRLELRSLKDSVKFCSDTCDGVKALTGDVKGLRREIQELTKINKDLRQENDRLLQRLEEVEQYQRSNNLEIKGVPDVEDVVDVVRKIGEVLDETVRESDIDICHRVPTVKQGEKNIVVRFVHRTKRNALLAKSRKQRMTTGLLGLDDLTTPIFVNEHLTRHNKQILGAAIARKKEAGWKFVWSSGGKVYARKDEAADAVRISTRDDLAKIVR